MIYELTDTAKAVPLFAGWEETLIWSCLQGLMGYIYTTDLHCPVSALAVLGDFAFFAGKVNSELVSFYPPFCKKDFLLLVPQDRSWESSLLKHYGKQAKRISRYATKKEPAIFDIKELNTIAASLPAEYELSLIDRPLYNQCREMIWSRDLVSQFQDYDTYRRLGLGVVIRQNRQIISGASSYSRYDAGIEIEIDTKKEYRRRGLASICGARLILECLQRELYPSWDAHSRASLTLAEKLGYHYSHTYSAIEITLSPAAISGIV